MSIAPAPDAILVAELMGRIERLDVAHLVVQSVDGEPDDPSRLAMPDQLRGKDWPCPGPRLSPWWTCPRGLRPLPEARGAKSRVGDCGSATQGEVPTRAGSSAQLGIRRCASLARCRSASRWKTPRTGLLSGTTAAASSSRAGVVRELAAGRGGDRESASPPRLHVRPQPDHEPHRRGAPGRGFSRQRQPTMRYLAA